MGNKSPFAADYTSRDTQLVRAACLYVATKLGDLMDDIVIVGGLVPTLLIDGGDGHEPHVGTKDLDLGFKLAVLDEERYQEISARLRRAHFEPDRTDAGNIRRQTWKFARDELEVTVDFLIPPVNAQTRGGSQQDLESDFAAIVTPGLELAFQDRVTRTLTGETLLGEQATRDVHVCGPGAFVVLKALAFDNRGENKDAYDLFYVVRNFGEEVADVAGRLSSLLDSTYTSEALKIIKRDFSGVDDLGPRRVAAFLYGEADDQIQADVVAFLTELLAICDA